MKLIYKNINNIRKVEQIVANKAIEELNKVPKIKLYKKQ